MCRFIILTSALHDGVLSYPLQTVRKNNSWQTDQFVRSPYSEVSDNRETVLSMINIGAVVAVVVRGIGLKVVDM